MENAPTHTRSNATVRVSTSTSGETDASCFGSMLTRTSGQAPSRSSNNGMGSRPSTLAFCTADHGNHKNFAPTDVCRWQFGNDGARATVGDIYTPSTWRCYG